ncbi:MAG: lipid-transfer protein [Chloroflexi bacterium]|nr:lipid-transfer protein [Chloroflexota bacterium]
MDNPLRDKACIVGIGQTAYSRNSGRSEVSLAVEAVRNAVADAGLTVQDIDGLLRFEVDRVTEPDLATCLGLSDLPFFGELGPLGAAACGLLGYATMAIVCGMASNVVIYRSLNGRSGTRFGAGAFARGGIGNAAFWEPYGLMVPGQWAALAVRRHMHQYGTTDRQLGAVAVALRKHACMNPRAVMYGKPITLEDHQASRVVHDPLRLLDCCLETDGACAIVVTSAERARTLKQRPVYAMATAQNVVGGGRPRHAYGETAAYELGEAPAKYLAPRLFQIAGVTPQDIDCVQLYDPFTCFVIFELEGYGFCKVGDGGPFVEAGNIEGPHGSCPVNTAGGNMSEVYLQGLNHMIEGVRQLRGTSTCQIPDCELVLCDSGGGIGGAILRR